MRAPASSLSRFRALPAPLLVAGGLLLGATFLGAVPPVPPELCGPTGGVPLNDHFVQPESTRKMARRVREIYAAGDPLKNLVRDSEQVPLLRALDAKTSDPAKRLEIKMSLALHLLQSSQHEEALKTYDDIDRFLRSAGLPPDPQRDNTLLTYRAMVHLRRGEEANCLLNHNGDSCLFPIRGGGVHQLPEGSRAAVAGFTDVLNKYPADLRARWLLNIAYQTLGEWPDKVPAKWLIAPRYFASDYPLPRFPDVAGALGLDVDGLAGGVVMEDFDHDGFLDVMVSAWGFTDKDQLRVFRNQGDGTFEERTEKAGLLGIISGLNMIHTDYDNDGFADVLIMRGAWLHTEGHYPFTLLHNNGDFTFTDVTEQAGIASHERPTQAVVWFDYNGDGWLDFYVGNESVGESNPNELWRNNGDGTFTNVAAEMGVNFVGFFKGVASGDYNNDGRPDLFLSNRQGDQILLRNDGPAGDDRSPKAKWRFTNVTEQAGINPSGTSFPCWFFDYDNDGWEDLMITGYSIQNSGDIAADVMGRPHSGAKARLYHNNRDGTFTDVSKAMGVNKLLHTMGNNFGDLDNDGWLDFYAGTGDPDLATLIPARMFRNDGGKRFQDVTTAGGFGQLQKGHGIAFGDLDNDGDQDIFSKVGGAAEADHYPSQVFLNPGFGNRWLKLLLEGVKTNRAALGARVKVVVRENGVERTIHRTVRSGSSFGSSTFRQEIGLGQATAVERVEIFWPVTGQTQVFTGLEPDHAYRITEGQPATAPLLLNSFVMSAEAAAGAHHHHHK